MNIAQNIHDDDAETLRELARALGRTQFDVFSAPKQVERDNVLVEAQMEEECHAECDGPEGPPDSDGPEVPWLAGVSNPDSEPEYETEEESAPSEPTVEVLASEEFTEPEVVETVVVSTTGDTIPAPPVVDAMQNPVVLAKLSGGTRGRAKLDGVCERCCHCGFKLTDAISIQKGMGPICSAKGYDDPPEAEPNEVDALIAIAEFPDLVEWLEKNHRSSGIRSMMNGLVRIAALNRKTPVHAACCDAVQALGFRVLASKMRESICVVDIHPLKGDPNSLVVWVRKDHWQPSWSSDLRRQVPTSFFSRAEKGIVFNKTDKAKVWGLMKKHYAGLNVVVIDEKGEKTAHKIVA